MEVVTITMIVNVITQRAMSIKRIIVVNKLEVPSYWILFILLPSVLVGFFILVLSLSIFYMAISFFALIIIGEHGIRWWFLYLNR